MAKRLLKVMAIQDDGSWGVEIYTFFLGGGSRYLVTRCEAEARA